MLTYLISLKPQTFIDIDFSRVIIISNSIKSMQFIKKFFPYKYKYSLNDVPYSFNDHINRKCGGGYEMQRWFIRSFANPQETEWYFVKSESNNSYIDLSQYKIMLCNEYTKEEIIELKWSNRKNLMLLGYGIQSNSLHLLSKDLIRNISICL